MSNTFDNKIQIQKRKVEKERKREREVMIKEVEMHNILHDDLYFGKHIYAEPVCSRRLHSELKED